MGCVRTCAWPLTLLCFADSLCVLFIQASGMGGGSSSFGLGPFTQGPSNPHQKWALVPTAFSLLYEFCWKFVKSFCIVWAVDRRLSWQEVGVLHTRHGSLRASRTPVSIAPAHCFYHHTQPKALLLKKKFNPLHTGYISTYGINLLLMLEISPSLGCNSGKFCYKNWGIA